MPTGYTYKVQNGEVTTLREYAMNCARAFGALIEMRDDPSDAPIPDYFAPSEYHLIAEQKAWKELAKLERMSPADAQAACQRQHSADMAAWRSQCDRVALERVRYRAMLLEVAGWRPPTKEHIRFHTFMIEQLTSSIDFDCSPVGEYSPMPRLKRWPEWLEKAKAQALKDIEYHQREYSKELVRTGERNTWVGKLRESLN